MEKVFSEYLELGPMFLFQPHGNVDHEKLAGVKTEIEGHRQRLLDRIAACPYSYGARTQKNAEKVISWLDPNSFHHLHCRAGFDGEIIIELNTADQLPQFRIEIEEHEAYVWIDFKTIPPIQFRIPLEV